MTDFTIVSGQELDSLLALVEAYYCEDAYPFVAGAARDALAALLANPELGYVWFIRVGGEISGYLAVTFGYSIEYLGKDAFIDELYILPAWRGRGIGKKAIAWAETACRERGVRALHLEVERGKGNAISLYERAGFARNDRMLMTKWLDEQR